MHTCKKYAPYFPESCGTVLPLKVFRSKYQDFHDANVKKFSGKLSPGYFLPFHRLNLLQIYCYVPRNFSFIPV